MKTDKFTAGSIGIVTYLIADFSHEALGHGIACLALGGKVAQLTSTYVECTVDAPAVTAAGSVVNVLAGVVAFGILALARHGLGVWSRYFFWLLGTLNLLVAGGYLMVSPLFGFGDWFVFSERMSYPWPWKIGLTVLGVGIGLVGARSGGRALGAWLGSSAKKRGSRLQTVTWAPYLAGSLASTVAGLLNPLGWKMVLMSAVASSFFGTCWLVFFVPSYAEKIPCVSSEDWPRHRGWIAAGATASIVWLIFGRGCF